MDGFKELNNALEKVGLVLFYFLAAQTDEGKLAFSSLIYTMEKAGFQVEIMNFLNRVKLFDQKEWGGNPEGFILAAKQTQVDLHEQELKIDRSLLEEIRTKKEAIYLQFVSRPKPQLLTDDLPILDLFHAETALKYRKLSIELLNKSYGNE